MASLFIWLLIASSVMIFIGETLPEHAIYDSSFLIAQQFIVFCFSAEYIIRKTWKHPFKPIALVDLLAVLSFFTLALPPPYQFLQILRWSVIFKLTRYTKLDDHIVDAFNLVKKELLAFGVFLVVILLLSSSAIYYAEHAAQPDKFVSIPHCLWWSVVTLTTVGYGDVYPVTLAGKVIAGIVMLSGVAVIAIPTAFWTSAVMEVIKRDKDKAA